MDKELAFKSFFGISPAQLRENIIVTNIFPIYTGLLDNTISVVSTNRGFYEISDVKLSNGYFYDIIKTSPGSNIIDVVKLLASYAKKIVFIGIAGCLNLNYKLGDVCKPNEFVSSQLFEPCTKLAICQTSGLIQTDSFYHELRNKGVSLVDMECNDIKAICTEYNIPFEYIVQISDFPLEVPFYYAEPQPINIDQIIRMIGDE